MSDTSGQPVEWIIVKASLAAAPAGAPPAARRRAMLQAPAQQTPLLLTCQVHAPADQVASIEPKFQAALAAPDYTLQRQLLGIGLRLINGSGEREGAVHV